MFFSKMHHTDNPILRTLIYLPTVKYEIMGLATKYGLNGVQCGVSVIKEAVWLCFKQNVQFEVGLFVVTCRGHFNILCSFLCDVWDIFSLFYSL